MKNTNKSIPFLLFFLVFTTFLYAQNKKVESLSNELSNHTQNDTVRVNLLNKLTIEYSTFNNIKAEKLAHEANDLAREIKYKKGEAKSFFLLGKTDVSKSEFDTALKYVLQALKLYENINDTNGISSSYSLLGTISFYKNDTDKALSYYNKALDIAIESKNKKKQADFLSNIGNISYSKGDLKTAVGFYKKSIAIYDSSGNKALALKPLNNIGIIHQRQGRSVEALGYFNKCLTISKAQKTDGYTAVISLNIGAIYFANEQYNKALNYYKESLTLNRALDNKLEMSKCLIALGRIDQIGKEYKKALDYYNEALTINNAIENKSTLYTCHSNIGSLHLEKSQPKIALSHFKTCLDLSLAIENKRTICHSYISLAETNYLLKKYSLAIQEAIKGKQLADDLSLLNSQKEVNIILSKIYEATGKHKKSLKHFKLYKTLNDSLFNKENIEKITQLEYEYKYKQELESANNRELKLTQKVITTNNDLEKSQKNLLLGVISFLVITLILAAIIFFLKLRNVKSKAENIVTEQRLLRSQMTPHFIFNSLSVLQGMILNNEDKKSVSYLSKFSKLLRITLENSRDKTVLLCQELIAVENYLELQNLEVIQPYKYTVLVDDTIDRSLFKIPPMLIQPFIENAIEHAFRNQKENRKIDIHLTFVNKKLICTITDNGIGIDSQTENKTQYKKSLATTITTERLKILSKDFKIDGAISIEDRQKYNEKGTIVTLVIPYKKYMTS